MPRQAISVRVVTIVHIMECKQTYIGIIVTYWQQYEVAVMFKIKRMSTLFLFLKQNILFSRNALQCA